MLNRKYFDQKIYNKINQYTTLFLPCTLWWEQGEKQKVVALITGSKKGYNLQ